MNDNYLRSRSEKIFLYEICNCSNIQIKVQIQCFIYSLHHFHSLQTNASPVIHTFTRK